MWLDLPKLWIVILNAVPIPAIHLGFSWWFTRIDRDCFDPDSWLYRVRSWEEGGKAYQTLFHIRRWKHLLPDAATWFDGFAKGELKKMDPPHLRTFVVETCRGEAAHWVQIPGLLLTLIWNPWPTAAAVMIVYAFASNFPCLLLQRFTRARLVRFLEESGGKERRSTGR